MVRFLLVITVLCFAGCGKSQFHAKADALIEKLKQDNVRADQLVEKAESLNIAANELAAKVTDISTGTINLDLETEKIEVLQALAANENTDTDTLLLAAVQAEYEEALSQYVAIGDQVREKSRELTSLVKLKKLTEDNLSNLRNEVDRLTSEQNAADKAKQEADAIRDNNISQNWRGDVYAPGLVVPTGDR